MNWPIDTRDEENGVISPRTLHVKRKDLTSLFGKKDTINEMISGGNQKTTAFVLPPRLGPVKPLQVGMSPAVSWKMRKTRRCEDAKMWVNHALNKIEGRGVHSPIILLPQKTIQSQQLPLDLIY
jgi:hypothetical protein